MKLYSTKEGRILYALNPDLYFILEDEYMELFDILASSRLNGHNRFDQWMMKMEIKMKELLDTMSELDDDDTLLNKDNEEIL